MNTIPANATVLRSEAPGQRCFLLLQGPHGPFFDRLARLLQEAGAEVWRVAFNAGDAFFWTPKERMIRHDGSVAEWPQHLDRLIAEKHVTDIVLYGDVRPVHSAARMAAEKHNLTLHAFEEGYLRPFWLTYERGGSNGFSRLMKITLPQMGCALQGRQGEVARPPAVWGDMRQHKFYGAVYHFLILAANKRFPNFRTHRDISLWKEFRLNFSRLVLTPMTMLDHAIRTWRIRRRGNPFSLVLMQLEHDSSFRAHSDYKTMAEFTDEVLEAFATHAPRHHHIVFKGHPLDDGRSHQRHDIMRKAQELGVAKRVHHVPGGKLAPLLGQARSVITVNSTAAQQALWRGLPVKAMGRAVFDKPQLVSEQSLAEFFVHPQRPNPVAYRCYRDYLLETSQIPGGFYATRARAPALRLVVDMMLAAEDPYDALANGKAEMRQQPGADSG
ncbi:capsule biosynthesis protein [Paracoccus aerodenitrificans]|uniref:capsule biosynthesis protein n=1 Tax=Paracoccus aerodenitrificans TaxID=3017781 RepID=UPI0022F139AD|nr:capsule biosynthesis protein CapA [Paracoccus aerodenitrificans]WBU65156.1 capsule biosynthesis protein CapA [Paracoccus aerodenitrificans]